MNNTDLIIKREYLERVNKKSFIVTTLLVPVLFLLLSALPTLLMLWAPTSTKNLAVIDDSGIVLPQLKDTDDIRFFAANASRDEILANDSVYGLLIIDRNILANPKGVRILTPNSASATTESEINSQMSKILQDEKLKAYNIDNLDQILKEVRTEVNVKCIRLNDLESEGEEQSAAMNVAAGFMLNFVLYFFITLYGGAIMNSIVEEKGNRVLEIIVSSVKPMQLMVGKIIGVGLVALTQILIWGAVILFCSTVILPMALPSDLMAAGGSEVIDDDLLEIIGAFSNVGHIAAIFGYFVLFLLLGYLIYSAIFAMIGSTIDNVQDASQLQILAMLPIMLGFFSSMAVVQDPGSTFAVVMSLFPLTAPMVMMSRIPFGVPAWEIITSIVLLILTVVLAFWFAGKIYRVGIFMYGKKPTVRDLLRWFRYA